VEFIYFVAEPYDIIISILLSIQNEELAILFHMNYYEFYKVWGVFSTGFLALE
jgi:hypothetical protein